MFLGLGHVYVPNCNESKFRSGKDPYSYKLIHLVYRPVLLMIKNDIMIHLNILTLKDYWIKKKKYLLANGWEV